MSDPQTPNPKPIASGQSRIADTVLVSTMESTFAGPLPSPSLLQGYENACPGSALRIIAMAEAQGNHRRQIEDKMSSATVEEMRLQFAENRRGQICAVLVSVGFIVGGVYVAINGHPWPGALLGGIGGGGTGLIAIVRAFLNRKEDPGDGRKPPEKAVSVRPPAKKRGKR